MRIISKNRHFPAFIAQHPDSESPLNRWYQATLSGDWKNFDDVRRTFPTASYVKERVVFNIGGGKYRLVVGIDFEHGIVFLKYLLTHPEYDKGDWKNE